VPGPGPDQGLVFAGEQFDGSDLGGGTGDGPVVVPVGTHQISKHLGIAASDFAPESWCRSR